MIFCNCATNLGTAFANSNRTNEHVVSFNFPDKHILLATCKFDFPVVSSMAFSNASVNAFLLTSSKIFDARREWSLKFCTRSSLLSPLQYCVCFFDHSSACLFSSLEAFSTSSTLFGPGKKHICVTNDIKTALLVFLACSPSGSFEMPSLTAFLYVSIASCSRKLFSHNSYKTRSTSFRNNVFRGLFLM